MNKFDSINEAVNVSSARGEGAKYSEVDLSTPFVKKMIAEIAVKQGKDVSVINLELEDQIKQTLEGWKDKPDSFYAPSRKNIVESLLFDMIDTEETVFNEKIFYYLFNVILAKNKSFLKIVNPITGKRLKLNIILTPQPSFVKQPDWVKSVKTAAASPEGDVIFNLDFCKKLVKYSEMKDLKPKGSQYAHNGGKVPDSYSYIEFLILHEIYHIVHADHFYQSKKKGMTGKMQNYLGDYITNYNLVKNGYDQLPIGLYSDTYNYDNYISMDAMQDAIIEDFKELTEDDKDDMDKQQDDHMDENHEEKGDEEQEEQEQEDGESESGDSEESEDGEDGESEDGESSDGESEDGEESDSDSKPSKGEDGEDSEDSEKSEDSDSEIDDAFKDADENFEDADDGMSQEELDDAIDEMKKEEQADKDASDKRKESLEQAEQDRKDKIDAKLENLKEGEPIRWEQLIKKMMPKAVQIEEETSTKMHKRTRGQLAMGNDKVAMKNGVRYEDDESQSLLFILDSSGSMASTIQGVSVELLKLINKSLTNGIKSMWIIRFDSKYRVYKINLDHKKKKHTYQELDSPKELLASKDLSKIQIKDEPKPIKKLFQLSWGGGTEFPHDIFLIIKKFLKEDFNQVLFTDSDIQSNENIKNLAKACKVGKSKKFSFNVILNSKTTYNNVKQLLGGTYKYMSYLGGEY